MNFTLLKPLDQPSGESRLLACLRDGLENADFCQLNLIVAYAKSGPFLRLEDPLRRWRERGGRTFAMFGVDQQGTSREALEIALAVFDEVSVLRVPCSTFHPKMYWFQGPSCVTAFVGSTNFTVGGTEVNFEAAAQLDFALPDDAECYGQFATAWDELLPLASLLDRDLLDRLVADGCVVNEGRMQRSAGGGDGSGWRGGVLFQHGFTPKPPSPLPGSRTRVQNVPAGVAGQVQAAQPAPANARIQGFALQIRPHHNGEIFLSVSAVRANPEFFGWPFTGQSTPRAAGAAPYPHREPVPIVNIVVYGADGTALHRDQRFRLTTVYYDSRSEIRITSLGITNNAPELSIMVMELSDEEGVEYEINIYHPESPQYADWLAVCNQTMPGGGAIRRRFGWY